jgi:processive 1,2-diacylglycerol beta-glucosyltransferase
MLKIGIITPINKGKLYHRVEVPFAKLADRLHITIFDGLTVENPATNYDVLILNGAFMQPTELLYNAKKQGVKIIWDVDDWIELPTWHDKYDSFQNFIFGSQQREIARLADVIWVASKELHRRFNSKKTHYIPNAIDTDDEQWKKTKRYSYDVVWTGGSTHYSHIAKMLNEIQKKKTIILGGYDEKNAQVWNYFDNQFGDRLAAFPNVSAYEYGEIYSYGKVAIAPLENNPFNQCRSVLKALEAAAYGLPFATDNTTTYADVPKIDKPFKEQVKLLLQNKCAYDDYAARLMQWADKNYNLTKINQLRYETII